MKDANNSTVLLENPPAGGGDPRFTYEPFGNTTIGLGQIPGDPIAFTGRELDPSGLYFMRNRYYNPVLQRFLSPDPIGYAGGSINLYAYVNNDPLNSRDPLGLKGGGGGGGWPPDPEPVPPPPPPSPPVPPSGFYYGLDQGVVGGSPGVLEIRRIFTLPKPPPVPSPTPGPMKPPARIPGPLKRRGSHPWTPPNPSPTPWGFMDPDNPDSMPIFPSPPPSNPRWIDAPIRRISDSKRYCRRCKTVTTPDDQHAREERDRDATMEEDIDFRLLAGLFTAFVLPVQPGIDLLMAFLRQV